jgi:hypothetical protein
MNFYYFEPLSSPLNEAQISSIIGSVVLNYSPERQREIGLFRAFYDDTVPYNHFSETLNGYTWVRYEDSTAFQSANPDLYQRVFQDSFFESFLDFPFYVQTWSISPLTEPQATVETNNARLKVATEAANFLSKLSGYATQNGCPDSITTYISQILSLSNHPDYPHVLANDARLGTYTSWPTFPDLTNALESIASAPVTTTNADIAFNRILNAYSIPGSYPQKVSAITSAVNVYGVNGSVTDLYNYAVNILNSNT